MDEAKRLNLINFRWIEQAIFELAKQALNSERRKPKRQRATGLAPQVIQPTVTQAATTHAVPPVSTAPVVTSTPSSPFQPLPDPGANQGFGGWMLETWRGLGRYGPTDDVVFSRVAEIRNDLVTKPSIELTPDDISYSKYLESLVKQLDYQEEMDQ
ncbi:MAG: hypothetical protein MMC33_010066 [Icmadophila ericetorum]|nr:hypothetical protein [Icmadophila ericetorum]